MMKSDVEELQIIFFRKLGAHPNWNIDQIRDTWLLAKDELLRIKEQYGKCPRCGLEK